MTASRRPRSIVSIGTRGSQLALVQTEWVIDRLRARAPEIEFRPKVITTTGDRRAEAPLGEAIFVEEIQRALLDGEIEMAVHSLKDLPTEPIDGLRIAAIPRRADPRDALVGSTLGSLLQGARVGTGSLRRAAQLLRLRPDLQVVPIRGNVPTRVEKARSGEVDAVMLAAAGLSRLGLQPDEIFGFEEVLPAPGQGALAVEARWDDLEIEELVGPLDDPVTWASVVAERAVLREMGGGCLLPLGAFGRVEGDWLILDSAVFSSDGTREARAHGEGDWARPEDLAGSVAESLINSGALALL